MFWRKSIEDLKSYTPHAVGELREKVKIMIIDDEDFRYFDMIKRHDFKVFQMKDLDHIQQVEAYGVVLCDIKGVGKKFKSRFEGAHIISEIRKRYPLKVIVGYTGHQFDADYNRYFSMCDIMLKKDIDEDDWIESLDMAIKRCLDPVEQWNKIRSILFEQSVATATISDVESDYVKYVLGKSKEFPSSGTMKALPSEVKDLLVSLGGNAIFHILVA